MAILYFRSTKEAERAIAQTRHASDLKAHQGKVIFVPPSEEGLLRQLGFSFEEVDREKLEELLCDEVYARFSHWQLHESYRLRDEEPATPPWNLREAYFDIPEGDVGVVDEVFKPFSVENVRWEREGTDAFNDKVRVRFYVHRKQLDSLEQALKAARICGHTEGSVLYKCKHPDEPSQQSGA